MKLSNSQKALIQEMRAGYKLWETGGNHFLCSEGGFTSKVSFHTVSSLMPLAKNIITYVEKVGEKQYKVLTELGKTINIYQ